MSDAAPSRFACASRAGAALLRRGRRGARGASGPAHTEGPAADLALAGPQALRLWHAVRDLDCCGAGYYAKQGFVHVDVGRPRFWEAATPRVDQDLSAGNARLFARAG